MLEANPGSTTHSCVWCCQLPHAEATATLIVLVAAVALITWKIVLRVVGMLCFIAALAGIASGSDPLTGAFVAF
ncbi:MAG TPA: hypothetical protein VGO80_23455 [Solirubrobacteraceae bacterium]|jgi:hypothetical protein|nr:hypothetical protein [Solirubrobacteraceae bacterium]